MAGTRPEQHHAVWLWIGSAAVAVAILFLLIAPASSRWTSGDAVAAYCLGLAAVFCVTMAVKGQPFPPHLPTFSAAGSQPEPKRDHRTSVLPDAATMLRPLLKEVRAELVTHRDELNRVMVRNRTEGLLNIFWARTNTAREQIAALDTKKEVSPAISDAYGEVERFAGEIDSSRIGGGPLRETDAIERTAVSVYAAILRIDSWEARH